MIVNENGDCVTPPVDLCPNIDGPQSQIPGGMIVDGQGNCVTPPPVCLDPSHVSYTYSNTQNLGIVTVAADPNFPGVTELCKPFWVTAVSWTFLDDDTVWPQALDKVQYLDLIHAVGTYPYSAPVTCGQGDIYAAWFDANLPNSGQPIPPAQLNGPNDPWAEHFLHDMGFTGPAPTYMQNKPGCNVVTPVEPEVTVIDECGTYGQVVPADTEGVLYTVTGNGGVGEYKVVATAKDGSAVAGSGSGDRMDLPARRVRVLCGPLGLGLPGYLLPGG